MSEPLSKTNLTIEMGAYPTVNPMWDGSLKRKDTGEQLVRASLQFDYNASYSGNIHETLTRKDLWEQVGVHVHVPPQGGDRRTMVQYLTEQLATDATGVLEKARQFYPQLKCRADAELCVRTGQSYAAITMIAAEVPHDTPWSTENTVGITDANGVFSWRPVTFGMEWNLGVGYIILCEAMRRRLRQLGARNPFNQPPSADEEDDDDDPQGCLAAGFVRVG